MLHRTYTTQDCSMARALEVVGERWSMLIVRDAMLGLTRFDDFEGNLGIARNILATRLELLCDEGILERRSYQERPPRYDYLLTKKGNDLYPALMALLAWGDHYYAPDGPPRTFVHRGCGGHVRISSACDKCGDPLDARAVDYHDNRALRP